jgi:hypothetical protein
MKSLLLGLLIFGITNQMHSQNPPSKSETKSSILQNIKYLEHVNAKDNPIIVMKLENVAAQYNITESSIYKQKSNTTYEVVFEESNGKIVATYNKSGEIIKSVEEYNNLKLPIQVSVAISKKYPGWSFASNTHRIIYKNGSIKKMYDVIIKNNSTTKELKFELDNSPESNYLAVN